MVRVMSSTASLSARSRYRRREVATGTAEDQGMSP
jgi:hypothetical protein